jgi:hypothetical protein
MASEPRRLGGSQKGYKSLVHRSLRGHHGL